MEGSRSASNNADMAYHEMVKNLEEARQLWDREMELLCKVGRRRREGTGARGERENRNGEKEREEKMGRAAFNFVHKIASGWWSLFESGHVSL